MVEKFSNPNCNPCRIFDRKFDTLRILYADKIDVIEYTTSFPSPVGYFKLNVSDNTDRQRYYRLGAVPMLCINGVVTGTPDFTEELINNEYNKQWTGQTDIQAFIEKDTIHINGSVAYKLQKEDSICVRFVLVGKQNKNQMQQIVGKHTGFLLEKDKVGISVSEALKNTGVFRAEDALLFIVWQDERTKKILAHNIVVPVISK